MPAAFGAMGIGDAAGMFPINSDALVNESGSLKPGIPIYSLRGAPVPA